MGRVPDGLHESLCPFAPSKRPGCCPYSSVFPYSCATLLSTLNGERKGLSSLVDSHTAEEPRLMHMLLLFTVRENVGQGGILWPWAVPSGGKSDTGNMKMFPYHNHCLQSWVSFWQYHVETSQLYSWTFAKAFSFWVTVKISVLWVEDRGKPLFYYFADVTLSGSFKE